jgi:hypothetical protein
MKDEQGRPFIIVREYAAEPKSYDPLRQEFADNPVQIVRERRRDNTERKL